MELKLNSLWYYNPWLKLSSVAKPVLSYATKLEKVCKVFLRFQAPNIFPTYFHLFKIITTFQSIFFLTIYQGLFILLLPNKVVRASLLKILVENYVWK